MAPVKTLIQMDGDEHKAHRSIVNDWFKPGNVKKLQSAGRRARQRVRRPDGGDGRRVRLRERHRAALPAPGDPGDPRPARERLRPHAAGSRRSCSAPRTPTSVVSGEDEAIFAVILDFVSYFTELAGRPPRPPDGRSGVGDRQRRDRRRAAGRHSTRSATIVIVATAGHDTTSSTIAAACSRCSSTPISSQLLQARPELIDNARRRDHPLRDTGQALPAALPGAPSPLRDVDVRAGRPAAICRTRRPTATRRSSPIPSASTCGARTRRATLAFGFGRHFCLGAHLARMEIRALLQGAARRGSSTSSSPATRHGSAPTSSRAPRASRSSTACGDHHDSTRAQPGYFTRALFAPACSNTPRLHTLGCFLFAE